MNLKSYVRGRERHLDLWRYALEDSVNNKYRLFGSGSLRLNAYVYFCTYRI